jgi:hypothetical protein
MKKGGHTTPARSSCTSCIAKERAMVRRCVVQRKRCSGREPSREWQCVIVGVNGVSCT